jgi:hypothetical protein
MGTSYCRMRVKTLRISVVLLGCMILGIGCEPDLITDPILPGETAVLTVAFSPSPVYEGYGSKYRFTVFVDEVNGVGARIRSIKIEHVGSEGYVLETDKYDEYDVVRTFGTSRIEAYGRLMTSVELDDCSGCTRENWLIRADDDKGNYVEYSQSVELISR